jgi:hypothetical protein
MTLVQVSTGRSDITYAIHDVIKVRMKNAAKIARTGGGMRSCS